MFVLSKFSKRTLSSKKSTIRRTTKTTKSLVKSTRYLNTVVAGKDVDFMDKDGEVAGKFHQKRIFRSFWSNVEMGPSDPILGLNEEFKADKNPKKINLGVGAYRDDNGKPYILPTVHEAEKRIFESSSNHEYAPITGLPSFCTKARDLLLGSDSPAVQENRVVTSQTISGTGSLRLAADFAFKHLHDPNLIYVPDPSWANHSPLFGDAGFVIGKYSYYDPETKGFNSRRAVEDISYLPERSFVMMHVCAHNPTGVDPTESQWGDLLDAVKKRDHLVLFDCAYQGFASGNPEKDAYPVRLFVKEGVNPIICQSFAKNFGLYGERVGAVHFVTENEKKAKELLSQLKILIRPMYSNPPIHGAKIVDTILGDAQLTEQWRGEVKGMADRIISMRQALVSGLKGAGSKKNWDHITNQIGMFCYTGLSKSQVKRLKDEFSVYLVGSGRISIAGVTSGNVEYLANAIHEVTK